MIVLEENTDFYVWRDHSQMSPGLGVATARIEACMQYYQDGGFDSDHHAFQN